MRNYHTNTKILLTICSLLLLFSCSRKATDFRDMLNGTEIQYPGTVSGVTVLPGNGRLMLRWNPSPDPAIDKYVLFWNNGADSMTVKAVSHNPSDTVRCLVPGLNEYAYTFFLYSYDVDGNKSIVTEISNARVYGSLYQHSLYNRLPDATMPYRIAESGAVTLYFGMPDTINITTSVKYTNAAGVASVAYLAADQDSVTLPDYKPGEAVLYQSSYIPGKGALDTFYTNVYDTFPAIFKLVACDKSLFQEHDLPFDMGIYQSDTRVSKLWDGSVGPQGYPNIYHSDESGPLPRSLSFDMGKVYNNLAQVEETGRDCCNNPSDFEVWGIADITGAAPTVSSNDPAWKDQMVAKGWTLLTEAVRGDNGNDPMKFNFLSAPPPVRYIRIRVIHTSNNSNSVNISEFTFMNKE